MIMEKLIENIVCPDEELSDFDDRILYNDRLELTLAKADEGPEKINFQETLVELERRWAKRQEQLKKNYLSAISYLEAYGKVKNTVQ